MSEERLAPAIEVGALLRRAGAAGGFGAVLRRGDAERGTVNVVLLCRSAPPRLLERLLGPGGSYGWQVRSFDDSARLDQHLARAAAIDPDMWVIELDVPSPERFIAEMT